MNVPPSKKSSVTIVTEKPEVFEAGRSYISRLAYATELAITTEAPADLDLTGLVTVITNDARLYMPLSELVDTAQELERIEKEIKKDQPSRLAARRKILSVLYSVTETPDNKRRMRSESKAVDLAAIMFDKYGAAYANRNGGYSRIVKLGPRRGDAAEMVILELV